MQEKEGDAGIRIGGRYIEEEGGWRKTDYNYNYDKKHVIVHIPHVYTHHIQYNSKKKKFWKIKKP